MYAQHGKDALFEHSMGVTCFSTCFVHYYLSPGRLLRAFLEISPCWWDVGALRHSVVHAYDVGGAAQAQLRGPLEALGNFQLHAADLDQMGGVD